MENAELLQINTIKQNLDSGLKTHKELIGEIFQNASLEKIASSLWNMRNSGIAKDKAYINKWKNFLDEVLVYTKEKFQISELQKSDAYWYIHNLHRQAFLFAKAPEKPNISLFSPAGSYGSYYLGRLELQKNKNELPDMTIGGSAGALYPTLYELFRMAREENPEATKKRFPDIIHLIPSDLKSGDSMFWNGKKLIQKFSQTAQELIDIINESRKIQQQSLLSDISQLKFSEFARPIGVIASRYKGKGQFQEVLFSGEDNVLNAITASSNPRLGLAMLTGKPLLDVFSINSVGKVKFEGNRWNDGYHTNPMPTEWIYHFPQGNVHQINAIGGIDSQDSNYSYDIAQIHSSENLQDNKDMIDNMLMKDIAGQGDSFDRNNARLYIELGRMDFKDFGNIVQELVRLETILSKEEWIKIWNTVVFRIQDSGYTTDIENIDVFIQMAEKMNLPKQELQNILSKVLSGKLTTVNNISESEKIKIFEKIYSILVDGVSFDDEDNWGMFFFSYLMNIAVRTFDNLDSFKAYSSQKSFHPNLLKKIQSITINMWREYSDNGEKHKMEKLYSFSQVFSSHVIDFVESPPQNIHNLLLEIRSYSEGQQDEFAKNFENIWKKSIKKQDFEEMNRVVLNLSVCIDLLGKMIISFPQSEQLKVYSFFQKFLQKIDIHAKTQYLKINAKDTEHEDVLRRMKFLLEIFGGFEKELANVNPSISLESFKKELSI